MPRHSRAFPVRVPSVPSAIKRRRSQANEKSRVPKGDSAFLDNLSTGRVTGRRPRRPISYAQARPGVGKRLTTEADRMERSGSPLDRSLALRWRSRRGSSRCFGRSSSAATATAIAGAAAAAAVATVAAAVATAVATTVAATVATIAAVATTRVAIATAVAAMTAIAGASATAVTTIAAVTGLSFLRAAHQGRADDREENRDTKRQNTIHPRCLLKRVPYVRPNTDAAELLHPLPRRHPAGELKRPQTVTPSLATG